VVSQRGDPEFDRNKSHHLSPSPDPAHLYLDFLKHTLTRMLFRVRYKRPLPFSMRGWTFSGPSCEITTCHL
jgi:hypothetical protein